jgi:hypothetical protein
MQFDPKRQASDADAAKAILSIFRTPASHGRRTRPPRRLSDIAVEVRIEFVEAQRMRSWGR